MIGLIVLFGAVAVDRWYGEWPDRLHPVVWMGSTIRWLERWAPKGGAGGGLMGLVSIWNQIAIL